jgi:hypothetical protein
MVADVPKDIIGYLHAALRVTEQLLAGYAKARRTPPPEVAALPKAIEAAIEAAKREMQGEKIS